MKKMKIDIMKPFGGGNEQFVATLLYSWNGLFKFDIEAFYNFIIDKRPTLKGKDFNVYTDDKVVPVIHFHKDTNKAVKLK